MSITDEFASRKIQKALKQQFFRGNHFNFSMAMTGYVLMAGTELAISWYIQELVDTATGAAAIFTMKQMVGIMLVILLVDFLAIRIRSTFRPRFLARAMRQYKDYAFQELMKKSISSFQKENTATYLSAWSNDANSIETNYLTKYFVFVYYLLTFMGALVMMLWYSPILTFIGISLSFLPLLSTVLAGNRLAAAEKKVSDENERFIETIRDSLSGFSVIKSFRAEQQACRMFKKVNAEVEENKCKRDRLSLFISLMGQYAGSIAQMGVFLAGAYLAFQKHTVTAGVILVFVQLMNFAVQPMAAVPEIWANRKAAAALIKKLAEAVSENAQAEGEKIPEQLREAIAVEHLSFSYDGNNPVLQDVSVRFEAGKSYAIVGASGSGKSTLLNLLMAGYRNYDGSICYDGMELKKIRVESLYGLVSQVQQNVFLFNSSIQDNITMFQKFGAGDVERSIGQSGLSDLVEARGKEYLCGENGCNLSGGERQRISIARSLLRKTQVLLVDEATASLDKETAFHITNSILQLKGMTRIVVTHALEETLLEKFDGILVMKNGQVEECGKFSELMNKKGYFYSLYTISQ